MIQDEIDTRIYRDLENALIIPYYIESLLDKGIINTDDRDKLIALYPSFIRQVQELHNLYTLYRSDKLELEDALEQLKNINCKYAEDKMIASQIFGEIKDDDPMLIAAQNRQVEYLKSIYNN